MNAFDQLKSSTDFHYLSEPKEKQLEKADRQSKEIKKLKCKDSLISLLRKYGGFRFERIEQKSGDFLIFRFQPLFYPCPYWKEFQESAGYLGRFSNASSNSIESFYILSDGCFYNQDKKKIADHEEDFFRYISTIEYDYHAPVLESTYKRLREAGWYEGRKIDISGLVKECEENLVFLTEAQKRFIEEFSGIRTNNCYISDRRNPRNDQPEFYLNLLEDETLLNRMTRCTYIGEAKHIGENTVCIGWCFYDGSPLLLMENGMLLHVGHGIISPIGRTAMEGFNILLSN